jgi:hypothetical protein
MRIHRRTVILLSLVGATALLVVVVFFKVAGQPADIRQPIGTGDEAATDANPPRRDRRASPYRVPGVEVFLAEMHRDFASIMKREYGDADPDRFYEMLETPPANARALGGAIAFVAFQGRGEERAARAIEAFVKAPVDWSKWNGENKYGDAGGLVNAKWRALDKMGMVGTQGTREFLTYAMTPWGARDVAAAWVDSMPPSDGGTTKEVVLDRIRGAAAVGLAYFGDQGGIKAAIASEYTGEKTRLIAEGKGSGPYFNLLCEAMIRMAVIDDIGTDEYALMHFLSGAHNAFINVTLQYGKKYDYGMMDLRDKRVPYVQF